MTSFCNCTPLFPSPLSSTSSLFSSSSLLSPHHCQILHPSLPPHVFLSLRLALFLLFTPPYLLTTPHPSSPHHFSSSSPFSPSFFSNLYSCHTLHWFSSSGQVHFQPRTLPPFLHQSTPPHLSIFFHHSCFAASHAFSHHFPLCHFQIAYKYPLSCSLSTISLPSIQPVNVAGPSPVSRTRRLLCHCL